MSRVSRTLYICKFYILPHRNFYQILPASPHFSLSKPQEFVSVFLQGLQMSLDLSLREEKKNKKIKTPCL